MLEGYTQDNRFSRDINVPCYATDASFHLKPAAFMDFAQEMAYLAADRLHFGYDDLQTHHTAWVLSRFHFKFIDPPKWRDDITIFTWHKGLEGLFFMRDFEIRTRGDSDFPDKSKALVLGTSSWIVMDVGTRRLVRSDDVLKMVPFTTQCQDDAIVEPCPKIVMPKDCEPEQVGRHVAAYSDIDIIGHTNNARYIVWAMDCVDYETASNRTVKDVWINFNKETKPGEEVSLTRVIKETQEGKSYFIEGKTDDRSCFCARIDF